IVRPAPSGRRITLCRKILPRPRAKVGSGSPSSAKNIRPARLTSATVLDSRLQRRLFNKMTLRRFLPPRRQERKQIQKSPFHPPLTKGERGGFDEPWEALRHHSGHYLRKLSSPSFCPSTSDPNLFSTPEVSNEHDPGTN